MTIEAAKAEVLTRTFALEQVLRGSLTFELAKKELDAMTAIRDESWARGGLFDVFYFVIFMYFSFCTFFANFI